MWKTLRQLPLTILHWLSDGLERVVAKIFSPFGSQGEGDDDGGDDRSRSRRNRIWLLPLGLLYWLFRGALFAITFPVRAWFLPAAQRACFLRGLPAVAVATMAILGVAGSLYRRDSTVQSYISKTVSTFSSNEGSRGVLYAKRLVSSRNQARRENVYVYGLAQANSQNLDLANEVMASIAPNEAIGFAPAHQFRAAQLAQQLQRDADAPEEIHEQLQWHLENAGSRDEERTLVMWVQLHQARGDLDRAVSALEQAGNLHPMHFLSLANMEEKRNNDAASKRALERARDGLAGLLNQKPEDKLTRLQLAIALSKLKRNNEAERVLLSGLQLHRDMEMQRATADFYLLQFDQGTQDLTFLEKMSWLTRAMNIELGYREIYLRLVRLFDPQLSDDEKSQLKRTFEELVVAGPNPAAAHFALGLLASLSPDTRTSSAWHLNKAQELQPPVVLAYMRIAESLSLTEPPRLDEAEFFARQAISGTVQEAPLYFTLGKVLVSQAKWSEAIEILAAAIDKFPDSAPLHQSLAQAFEATGETTKATAIREIADRIENKAKSAKNAVSP